jgi:hypothetical protein
MRECLMMIQQILYCYAEGSGKRDIQLAIGQTLHVIVNLLLQSIIFHHWAYRLQKAHSNQSNPYLMILYFMLLLYNGQLINK